MTLSKMSDDDNLLALRKRAEKGLELIKNMDELFPNNKDEHIILVLMASITDAYKEGRKEQP